VIKEGEETYSTLNGESMMEKEAHADFITTSTQSTVLMNEWVTYWMPLPEPPSE
jgi:hypothetical protein